MKITVYGEFITDNYPAIIANEAVNREYLRYSTDLDDYVLLTDWSDIENITTELCAPTP